MRDLLSPLTAALRDRRPFVWCRLVETRGSTPQKAGAAMLVFPDGSQFGTLGGGCVEAEVKQRALRQLSEKGTGLVCPEGPEGAAHKRVPSPFPTASLLTFHLDDNYGWDDGLICGGRMSILADPLPTSAEDRRRDQSVNYYRQFQKLIDGGQGCTEAVVMSAESGAEVGSRFLFN